jgi:hypothetical protein
VKVSLRARLASYGVLAAATLLPIALTRCAPKEPTPATPSATSASPVATATATTTTALAPAPVLPSTGDAKPAQQQPRSAPPPLAAYTGKVPGSCAELEAAIQRTLDERACTTDDDCTTGARACGCAVAMARSARPKLDALVQAFDQRRCAEKGPPRPCASCPPPPPVACAAGHCEPAALH